MSDTATNTPYLNPSFDVAAVAELGSKANAVEIVVVKSNRQLVGLPDEVPAIIAKGQKPEVRSVAGLLEEFRLHPERKEGTARVQTLETFIDLTNRHKTGNSVVFANLDWQKPSLTAVIDYHEKANGGVADFCGHRIHYEFPLSEEWKIWVAKHDTFMEQEKFAYFLEDRIPDLSSPTDVEKFNFERDFSSTVATPSQLIELSRKMQVNVESKVKVNHALQSGERQLQWEEQHVGSDGKPITVPGMFILSIPPFFMGEKIRIPVRLRYRVSGGSVNWSYAIYRPDQVITEHLLQSLTEAVKATELPSFAGKPEID